MKVLYVTYVQNTVTLGCECCSESANYTEFAVFEVSNGVSKRVEMWQTGYYTNGFSDDYYSSKHEWVESNKELYSEYDEVVFMDCQWG